MPAFAVEAVEAPAFVVVSVVSVVPVVAREAAAAEEERPIHQQVLFILQSCSFTAYLQLEQGQAFLV